MDGSAIKIAINGNKKVHVLNKFIHERTGMKLKQQRLIFEGKLLNKDKTLYEYNIYNEATLHLNGTIQGGCQFENCCLLPETDNKICCCPCILIGILFTMHTYIIYIYILINKYI